MKVCTKCKKIKLLSDFYKRSVSRGGYCSECKSCTSKGMKTLWKRKKARRIFKGAKMPIHMYA